LAAEAQGKFVPMHDSLFQDQEHQDRTALEARARVIGLNIAAFNQALDRHEFAEAIDTDLKLGELASVHATPTIFVNGTRVLDPTNEGAIAQAIDSTIAGPTASPPKHALAE
jgi:protein-disulfide isomerase